MQIQSFFYSFFHLKNSNFWGKNHALVLDPDPDQQLFQNPDPQVFDTVP